MQVEESAEKCELCGNTLSADRVTRTYGGEELHFCCNGCAQVYDKAQENAILDQIKEVKKPAHHKVSNLILDRGETAHISVKGMWCAGCAEAAERIVTKQPGVKDIQINFASEQGRINYDPEAADLDSILNSLNRLGYQSHLLTDTKEKDEGRKQENLFLQLIVAVAFGMQVMLLYFVQLYPRYSLGQYNDPEVRRLQYLVWFLATPILFFGGLSFLKGAWRALRAGTANMDTLVALGTLAAYSYSAYIALYGSGEVYFDSVAMITTFIILGRYLETLGGGQARKDIRKLLQIQPHKAWKKGTNSWREISASDLVPGDLILVKPGSRIPADAKVTEGQAAVDESLLTGESAPIEKTKGDQVFAGTIALDNSLTCRVERSVKDTQLAKITHLVEETLSTKPPIQRLADKASAYFTIFILVVACLTGLGWYLFGKNASEALLAAVAVLVVACPCALGLATPLALTITIGRTAQAGILVRKNTALEEAAKVKRIIFDKTGTLTQGKMSVVSSTINPQIISSQEDLLCLAASVEQFSEHPIGRAIVNACKKPILKAHDFKSHRGLGASAVVETKPEKRILVGSENYLNPGENSVFSEEMYLHSNRGDSVVWVGWEENIAGFIALQDEPKPSAPGMLNKLREEHLDAVMLSGDNPLTTKAIARDLGITKYEGNCPPEKKAARIKEWQNAGEIVAMVGDGVNDAPALAQADISITIFGGTDIAGEISDVLLMHPDLDLIPWFLERSKKTRQIIIQNLGWAFLYNLVALPLAAFGLISPVIAAAAMATSSLLVVGNSLRLRR